MEVQMYARIRKFLGRDPTFDQVFIREIASFQGHVKTMMNGQAQGNDIKLTIEDHRTKRDSGNRPLRFRQR